MRKLSGKHILSVDAFDREMLVELYELADLLAPVARKDRDRDCSALDGAVLANLFFEPSTRTRTSFGSAFYRLGGDVVETTDEAYSSLVKGESLVDTARVISGYADVVVMRHYEAGSVRAYAEASTVPVISAGDGGGEHPTQALLDAYTMSRELRRPDFNLDGIRVAFVGDLKHGRTVHSLARLLTLYDDITFDFISPGKLRVPRSICDAIAARGHSYVESRLLRDGLQHADVVYVTRIQEERFRQPARAAQYRGQLAIDRAAYERFAPHQPILMHPLPRDSRIKPMELTEDLEGLKSFAVFRQAESGLQVRMGLFAAVLGLESRFLAYEMKPSYRDRQAKWCRQDKVVGGPTQVPPKADQPLVSR